MTYGVRTWSSNGTLEMDTDSFTYQILHNGLYKLGAQGNGLIVTVQIPGFNPANCVAVILPTQAAANNYANSAMPYQSVGVGVVTIRARNPSETDNFLSAIEFRLLVMRYKN